MILVGGNARVAHTHLAYRTPQTIHCLPCTPAFFECPTKALFIQLKCHSYKTWRYALQNLKMVIRCKSRGSLFGFQSPQGRVTFAKTLATVPRHVISTKRHHETKLHCGTFTVLSFECLSVIPGRKRRSRNDKIMGHFALDTQ